MKCYYHRKNDPYITAFFKCWYTVYCVSNLFLFILLPTFPKIFGIFILINASETNLHVMREYFIDHEKYFYFTLLHLDSAICIGAISLTATGMLFANFLKHICGIFKIARWTYKYRIQENTKILFTQNNCNYNLITIWMLNRCGGSIYKHEKNLFIIVIVLTKL